MKTQILKLTVAKLVLCLLSPAIQAQTTEDRNTIALSAQYAIDYDDGIDNIKGSALKLEFLTGRHINLGLMYKKASTTTTIEVRNSYRYYDYSRVDVNFESQQYGTYLKFKTDNEMFNANLTAGYFMHKFNLEGSSPNRYGYGVSKVKESKREANKSIGLGVSIGNPKNFTVDLDYQNHLLSNGGYKTRSVGVSLYL